MAHFAELDENNIVKRVIVVDNKETSDVNGVEKEYIGIAYCEKILGGIWKQTSYNHNFRKRYAGIGYSYDENLDAFIAPKPFPSWSLNKETTEWEPPVPMPKDGNFYFWDEINRQWKIQ